MLSQTATRRMWRRAVEKTEKRQLRSRQERRQIVEETLQPGVSVARIARAYEINANQLFRWRKEYREGRLEAEPNANKLLPVRIADADGKLVTTSRRGSAA